MRSSRYHIALLAVMSLPLVGCYAHYSWLAVHSIPAAGPDTASHDPQGVFSEEDERAAISIAASVAARFELRESWMEGLEPTAPDRSSGFRELAMFQGSGRNANLMLTVSVTHDGTILRFWISDLDHSQQTRLVGKLVSALKRELKSTFANREIQVGDGRKLRLYAG